MTHDQLVVGCGLPRHEARALLELVTGRPRTWLIAHGDEVVADPDRARFEDLAHQRRAGWPLAYLLGWREFHGRRFAVSPDVLIPRDDTDVLVGQALALAPAHARVLDLGTGSGIIAITLACERPDLSVVATDQSAAALAMAARNAHDAGVQARIEWRAASQGPTDECATMSWWTPLDAGERFDLIVSNPPYIAAADVHLDQGDLRHEPRAALTDGSSDGLRSLAAIVVGAAKHLREDGWLLLEHGHDQGPAVRGLLAGEGFRRIATHADLAGHPRVTLGRRPTPFAATPTGH